MIPVTGHSGRLHELAQALGCPEQFSVPDGVGGRFSVLSAVGLLPAAILGLNAVRLLEGAAAMNEHFRTAPPGQNVVLDYVGVCHLLESRRDVNIRVCSVWSKALEAIGLWYDQLLAESLGKAGAGSYAAYGRQHARPAFSRAAAPGRTAGQADDQSGRRSLALRSAARRPQRTGSGQAQ